MSPDHINALFELFGGFVIWKSIILLYRQKQVRGISIWTISFFVSWGFWNLFYYPHLNQWWSFLGGCNIGLANSIWTSQMIYYNYFYKGGKLNGI